MTENEDTLAQATRYAEEVAVSLWERTAKGKSPQWQPLSGDLMGLLMQIDNMICGIPQGNDGACLSADGR